jgi:hypothetical protein
MNKEFLHMQKLAGIITEGEYKAKLNEEISDDVKQYLNELFEIYLEGGDTFEEEPGENHTLTLEGDDERYKDDWLFNKAINQLQNSPIVLDYNKDYIGDYGNVNVKTNMKDIIISFIVPE